MNDAVRYFSARLAFETDVADVAAAPSGTVIIDTRSRAAWDEGHLPGALHLPTAQIPDRAAALVPAGTDVVVYCWGPACNGATKAALALARLGYAVREMLGGFEYWAREGLPYERGDGTTARRPVDPLTAPKGGVGCAC
ncbi:rhodanese-like domain-containing protein [Actinomadura flavalba]|uniref:rhodanese-like domain-containing protein n=1 Tax=Actinomadura flavalba TaxID=1120938 RepID=UPI000364FB44|nr:rhodanese-like domain-containing protein [Actinomadura flavalba]